MYTAMALIWRKPGTTPTFFQTHYDTVHIPLLQRLVGDTFPLTHTRHYVARREPSSPSNQSSPPPGSPPPGSPEQAYPPIILRGTGDPSDPDAYTVMQWRDEGAFRRFMDVFMREEVQAEMRRDEEVFLDTGREKVGFLIGRVGVSFGVGGDGEKREEGGKEMSSTSRDVMRVGYWD